MWTVCVFALWCGSLLTEPLMGTIVMMSVMNVFMNTDSFVLRAHQLKQFICYHTYLEDILRKVIQDLLNFDTFSNNVHYTKKSPCSILYQKLLPRFEKGNKSSNPVRALAFCKIKLSFIQFESCKTSNGNSFNIRSLKFCPPPRPRSKCLTASILLPQLPFALHTGRFGIVQNKSAIRFTWTIKSDSATPGRPSMR